MAQLYGIYYYIIRARPRRSKVKFIKEGEMILSNIISTLDRTIILSMICHIDIIHSIGYIDNLLFSAFNLTKRTINKFLKF